MEYLQNLFIRQNALEPGRRRGRIADPDEMGVPIPARHLHQAQSVAAVPEAHGLAIHGHGRT